jgi:hypothetical protein
MSPRDQTVRSSSFSLSGSIRTKQSSKNGKARPGNLDSAAGPDRSKCLDDFNSEARRPMLPCFRHTLALPSPPA